MVSFAALRLGFAPVTGIDIDPVAVHAAAGNAAMNGLAPTFLVGDATDPAYPLPAADVVVANIALRPILRLARALARGGRRAARPPTPRRRTCCSPACSSSRRTRRSPRSRPSPRSRARDDGTWLTLHLTRRA